MRLDKRQRDRRLAGRTACTGYRLPAAEEAAAYDRGTESEWTWFSSTLPLGQLDARTDAPAASTWPAARREPPPTPTPAPIGTPSDRRLLPERTPTKTIDYR